MKPMLCTFGKLVVVALLLAVHIAIVVRYDDLRARLSRRIQDSANTVSSRLR